MKKYLKVIPGVHPDDIYGEETSQNNLNNQDISIDQDQSWSISEQFHIYEHIYDTIDYDNCRKKTFNLNEIEQDQI